MATDGTSVWAAWTPPDGVLVVGHIVPGPTEIVWRGPPSSDLANGGHLVERSGGPRTETTLPPGTAPSGVAVVDGRIVVCGYVSGLIQEWTFRSDSGSDSGEGRLAEGPVLWDDCRLSVAWVSDGLLLSSSEDGVTLLRIE